MKRRILMVSAMILLLGSQVQMYAQKKGGPDFKRPGMEMKMDRKPGGPMMKEKAICHLSVERIQDYYLKKYRIRLSRVEAERILLTELRERGGKDRPHKMPHNRKPYGGHAQVPYRR